MVRALRAAHSAMDGRHQSPRWRTRKWNHDPEGCDEMTTSAQLVVQPVLSRQDRCDRCGAQAKVLALLRTGGELLFCGHHAREHRPGLGDIGAALIPDPEAPRLGW
jgi:hypothetical protein